jgi:holo-[acyl-carrier protein] synthase
VEQSGAPSPTSVGLGLDLVEIETIRLALKRDPTAAEAWLSARELDLLAERTVIPNVLAGRVAAKEAVVKALGCGFSGDVTWQDVEILSDGAGAPVVILLGGALQVAQKLGISKILVSITHVQSLAAATALAVR